MNNIESKTLLSNYWERLDKHYSPEEVLKFVPNSDENKIKTDFDGHRIKMSSSRLVNFKLHGIKCITCGIEGKYFIKERHKNDLSFHLNLYAMDINGKEVLMTKDHIVSIDKGGKNHMSNYQPMCFNCNQEKGTLNE